MSGFRRIPVSLDKFQEEIDKAERDGRLRELLLDYEFPDCPGYNPFHEACWDDEGARGQTKIEMLLAAAERAGVPARMMVAKKTRPIILVEDDGYGIGSWADAPSKLPLQLLVCNRHSSKRSWELVLQAWPEAMFTGWHGREGWRKLMDESYSLDSSGIRAWKVETMMHFARGTERGIRGMLLPRNEYGCSRFLIISQHIMKFPCRENRALLKHMLRECPEAACLTSFRTGTFLQHAFCAYRVPLPDKWFRRTLLQILASAVTPEILVAVLSTEMEEGRHPERSYGKTPICLVREKKFEQSEQYLLELARRKFGKSKTLLHYAAGMIDTFDREEEVRFRESVRSEFTVPNQDRRGTQKLIKWLIEMYPEACTQRDSHGRLPFHAAIESGKSWDNGIWSLIDGNPGALHLPDPILGLDPLVSASALDDITTAYMLLQSNPDVMLQPASSDTS